ncbi:hypothetical protein FRC09_002222 [Ceratobasidium sp. 395]|nr:hypothetical protein FRC09_002222 [Ceratobasidium sp. 395]
MSNDLTVFAAATALLFRSAPESFLMRRLDNILQDNTHYAGRAIEFRTDVVSDFRGQTVPATADRLLRWDRRHPDIVFQEGFRPLVAPGDEASLVGASADLGEYVDHNVPSIFVGTTRYRPHADTGRPTRWVPRNIANMFEYEVFAPGGIDVNLSLGRRNQYWNQHEIAFPGGIRREFIRTARQYDGSGRIVRLWHNEFFDVTASGTLDGEVWTLPDPVCRSSIDRHYWMGPSEDRPQRRVLMRAPTDEPLHGTGEAKEDDLMRDGCSTPHPSRAAFLNPYNPQEAYFFADTRYALVSAHPMTAEDKIINGPKLIATEWPSLKAAGFGRIDAVLPTGDGYEAYFFSRDKYALINTSPGTTKDYIINGPKKIATEWPALEKAGCKTVDAVLPVPGVEKQAYFFCGSRYSIIKYTPGTTDDVVIQEPRYTAIDWPSLAGIGFHVIHSVLPSSTNPNQAYFFYGDRYVLVTVRHDTKSKRIRGPRPVYKEWASLRQAKFYGKSLPTKEWSRLSDRGLLDGMTSA